MRLGFWQKNVWFHKDQGRLTASQPETLLVTVLTSKYSSMPWADPWRAKSDAFTPVKAPWQVLSMPVLMPTMPTWRGGGEVVGDVEVVGEDVGAQTGFVVNGEVGGLFGFEAADGG